MSVTLVKTRFIVGSNLPGCLPDNAPAVFVNFDEAACYLADEMRQWADSDDEQNDEYLAGVPESEQLDEWSSTRATVDSILSDDPIGPSSGEWSYRVANNDGWFTVWWLVTDISG